MELTLENTWITSDTHYMHTNICKGVTKWKIDTPEALEGVRDFNTLEEMNNALVENINKVVKEDDWLIHVGDWSFGGFEMIEEFRTMINCKNIILITGNHDAHIKRNREDVQRLFTRVSEKEELQIESEKFLFYHGDNGHPQRYQKDTYMLHGHFHSKGEKRFSNDPRRMDVGICGSPGFRPYRLSEVVDILNSRTK
jgi:calcineurin-like phosphoesterase family protein